jgi:hypothetical protein
MSLEQAVAENTSAIRDLITMLAVTRSTPTQSTTVAATVTKQPDTPATTQPVQQTAPTSTTPAAITYDTVKTAFLALIRQLGSAEAAKVAALTPLGLSDLKSNENKPDLFPAILEKITQAKAAV